MKFPADTDGPAIAAEAPVWAELNRQWLVAQFAALTARIETAEVGGTLDAAQPSACRPALLHCAQVFGLSSFERHLLLLLAGLQLDSRLREAVSARQPDGLPRVTFGFALSILPQPHWDALSPDAPLRYWRLIESGTGSLLADAPLLIDERMLHFIAGIICSDEQLSSIGTALIPEQSCDGRKSDLAQRIARLLSSEPATAVVLYGGDADPVAARDTAVAALAAMGRVGLWLPAQDVPTEPASQTELARHINRESALTGIVPAFEIGEGSAERSVTALAGRLRCPFLWLGSPGAGLSALPLHRRVLRVELPAPNAQSTRARLLERWNVEHGDAGGTAIQSALERAAGQFHLGPAALETMIDRLDTIPAADQASAAWSIAREAARGGLDTLAQRIPVRATLDDLVLPEGHLAMLRDIARQLRHREQVFGQWGFGARFTQGQGLVALFAGESGTGKTLAAEAIAEAAELDLYRVDLAMLVSKYIGETEKNLRSLFDAAEASGAVLLFDEADALFGKRSEVRDSHDRYANIEVAYLLQRVEAYRGLAILTTNMKSALDPAFLRRIRFVINFPFPGTAAREEIWRRQLPAEAPVGEVDFESLARLNLSGANIRSVVLNAAFKAADNGSAIHQSLLLSAAREEFAKLERTFREAS